jgi:hypothetical protein
MKNKMKTPTTKQTITTAQIKSVEKKVRCNKNHSGNRRLTFSVGYFECNGCGGFTPAHMALATLAGAVQAFDGAGSIIRIR